MDTPINIIRESYVLGRDRLCCNNSWSPHGHNKALLFTCIVSDAGWVPLQAAPQDLGHFYLVLSQLAHMASVLPWQKRGPEECVGSFYGPDLEVAYITLTYLPLIRTWSYGLNLTAREAGEGGRHVGTWWAPSLLQLFPQTSPTQYIIDHFVLQSNVWKIGAT